MEEKNIYITKKHIEDESFGELDFDLHEEFGFDYEKDDDFITLENGQGHADGYPIKIESMIETLQSLKDKGATHVELDYNCDHIGYEISGYSITPSTPEEITIYEDKKSNEGQKNKRLKELYAEIEKIKRGDVKPETNEDLPF
jgi:hypothetical protein